MAWTGKHRAKFLALLLAVGCRCNDPPPPPQQVATESSNAKSLAERGRAVYNTNCIACHNSNPKIAGSLGPEIYGSSKDLLEARIMRAAYPEGYVPKRPSAAMLAMPYLKDDIPALHVFLNQ